MNKFLEFSTRLYKHPKKVLVIAVFLTFIMALPIINSVLVPMKAGLPIPSIVFDNNIRTLLPKHNRDLKVHDFYEDESRFGSSSYVFVGIESNDAFSLPTLQFAQKVERTILKLNSTLPAQNLSNLLKITPEEAQKIIEAKKSQGINEQTFYETFLPALKDSGKAVSDLQLDKALADKVAKEVATIDAEKLYKTLEDPIDKVEDLTNADYIANKDDSLVTETLVPEGEDVNAENIANLKAKAGSWEIYKDVLYSKDGKMCSLVIKLNSTDIDVKASINKAVAQILTNDQTPGIKTYLDGEPVIEDLIGSSMKADIALLLPLVVFVVLLVLFLCFRNLAGMLYPSIVVLMGVVWAVGAMTWCNIPVSVVGTAMPVLMVAIASAYGIHQMNHYFLDPRQNKIEILDHNMHIVGIAILLSGITVMVGFGALIVEDFEPIKNFGIFTALGDLIAVVGALWVLPALILWSKKPKHTKYHESEKGFIAAILNGLVQLNKKHAKAVIGVVIVITLIFAVGVHFIRAELNNVSMFKSDAPVRIADNKLSDELAGTQVLNIIIDSDVSEPLSRKAASTDTPAVVTTPAILNKIEAFGKDVEKKFPYATKVLSFNTMVKKMNQEMQGGDPSQYVIPQDQNLISQYLMMISSDKYKSVLSGNQDKMRISVTMKKTSTDESEAVADYARAYFGQDFQQKNHVRVEITGAAHLYYVANTLLVDGTIKSVAICVVLVLILLLLLLRNIRMTLISMVPIAVTLVINFGILGLSTLISYVLGSGWSVPLNAGTAMVSSVAIGIGVDYSIHFITWYRSEIRNTKDIDQALENTIKRKGRAILYNMFVIIAGFLVMTVSNFVPLIQFGSLVAVCMLTTAMGALIAVPAIIKLLAKKNYKFLYLEAKASK